MTKKEAKEIITNFEMHGFKSFKGYCCQQQFNNQGELIMLGTNKGIYGWNWSLLVDIKNKRIFIDCYRF